MRRWILMIALVAGVAAFSLRAVLFDVGVQSIPAFDDECKISLQAKLVARGHFPLLIYGSPYIFPLEAYFQAPFINFLPRNAFGARIQVFCMGFLAILLSLLILKRWGSLKDTWPGVALILFPSGYILVLQVGCALPGYPTLMLLAVLVIWLAQRHAEADRLYWIPALLGGIAGGLAASDTMLALPILIMGGAMIAVARNFRTALVSAPAYGIGALIGLAPHLVAKHMFSGAFQAVQQSIPFRTGLRRIISPALDRVLPSAFGWGPPIFPDHKVRVDWLPGADLYLGGALVLLLAAFTIVSLKDFLRRWRQERWPRVDASLAFAGIAWMCLALFVFSSRSHHHTYRYFTPFMLSFPFLIAYAYRQSGKMGRWMLGAVTAFVMAVNLAGTWKIIERWETPGFADYLKSYDLKPAIAYLDQRGISRCYGTYADSYRITFETDERILCCQPYNERFPGWDVPFIDIVNAATNVAFVLSDTYKFPPREFEKDLSAMRVKYRKETCGHYKVYTDFEPMLPQPGEEIPAGDMLVTTSSNPEDAGALNDGDALKRWQSFKAQEKGMWIEIRLPSARPISQVKIYYNQYRHDRANTLRLKALRGHKWKTVLDNIPRDLDCFDFLNGHPVYLNEVQTLRFPAVKTDRLRLEIVEEVPNRDWTLGEIKVFEAQ